MIEWLMKWIFMDKRARDAAAKMRAVQPQDPPEETKKSKVEPASEAATPDVAEPDQIQEGDEKAALIQETMALYRKRREEYEQLDEGLRNKLTKLASDALNDKGKKAE